MVVRGVRCHNHAKDSHGLVTTVHTHVSKQFAAVARTAYLHHNGLTNDVYATW